MLAEQAAKVAVDARTRVPKAVGEVSYISDEPLREECRFFKKALEQNGNAFRRRLPDRPLPRHRRDRHPQRILRQRRTPISRRSAARCKSNTRRSSRTDFCCRSTRPIWGSSVTSPMRSSRLSDFLDFVERVVATINKALVNVPRDRVRLHVCWGNYEGPHDCDVPLKDILPLLLEADVGGARPALRQSAARARLCLPREDSAA